MLGVGEAAFFKIGSGLPPGNPLLHIYPLGAQQAQLVWSTNFPTCLLYYATNLPAAYWLPVTNLPVVIGTNFTVTVNVDLKQRYFLLRMPYSCLRRSGRAQVNTVANPFHAAASTPFPRREVAKNGPH